MASVAVTVCTGEGRDRYSWDVEYECRRNRSEVVIDWYFLPRSSGKTVLRRHGRPWQK